jgi:glycosyltransferase involved in cell wall biosynthesis
VNYSATYSIENPRLTIVMPAYNCRLYISESINSLLSQSFSDFELIVIDDSSTDGTGDELLKYADPRIRVFRNEKNLGVARSLNRGLSLAHGEYIIRMDADDISVPGRLSMQIEYMDSHKEIGILGGWIRYFGAGFPYTHRVPDDPLSIEAYMMFENPMCHVTVIMRRKLMEQHALRYNEQFTRSEDYELWTRAVKYFPMANLSRILVLVRRHGRSVTHENWSEVTSQTEKILFRMLGRLGLNPSSEEVAFHHRVGRGYRLRTMKEVDNAEKWLLELCALNNNRQIYDVQSFCRMAGWIWFRSCSNSTPLGWQIWKKWRASALSTTYNVCAQESLRFVLSILWHKIRSNSMLK